MHASNLIYIVLQIFQIDYKHTFSICNESTQLAKCFAMPWAQTHKEDSNDTTQILSVSKHFPVSVAEGLSTLLVI